MSLRDATLRRYNKQVLKAYPYPFTCTALQVSHRPHASALQECSSAAYVIFFGTMYFCNPAHLSPVSLCIFCMQGHGLT